MAITLSAMSNSPQPLVPNRLLTGEQSKVTLLTWEECIDKHRLLRKEDGLGEGCRALNLLAHDISEENRVQT